MALEEPIVQGKQVCKLMLVEINSDEAVAKGKAKQSNKFYNMYEQADDTFTVHFGRVDSSCQVKTYPMAKWASTIKSKTAKSKGYKDVTHLFHEESDESDESNKNTVIDIQDRVIKRLVDELQSFASDSVKKNYNVSSRAVTQAMIDEAQFSVNKLATLIKRDAVVKDINDELLNLYHVIPRKMHDVKSYLIQGDKLDTTTAFDAASQLLSNEQDTLDTMAGQVLINSKERDQQESKSDNHDMLTILGLEMREASDAEIDVVKQHLGPNANQFVRCYKVANNQTQKLYDNALAKADNKTEELFWHGSRNQNWLNILSTGLLIRPAGAIHSGSMFGDGIYFADKAQKSIGYTSLRGSYWASGSDNKAYLALFSVHVGEQKHIKHHNSLCYKLSANVLAAEGKNSVFAHGGADLRNNEYIVYKSNQCTVSYLVEISN